MLRRMHVVALLLAVSTPAYARTIPVRVELRRPPELVLPEVATLAVGAFEGDLGGSAAERLSARVGQGTPYRVLPGGPADAVVTGRVEVVAADDEETTPLYKNSAQPGGDPVVIQAPTRVRSGRAVVTFRVRSRSGDRDLAVRTVTGRWSARQIEDPRPEATCLACYLFRDNPLDESAELPGLDETRQRAVAAAVEEFVTSLAPREAMLDLVWDEGHRGIPGGSEILELLRAGRVEDARTAMQRLRENLLPIEGKQDDRALRATLAYDSGVVAEASGDLREAAAWYARAIDEAPGKPDRAWLEASRRVRQRVAPPAERQP